MKVKRIQTTKATLFFCFLFFYSRCIVQIISWFKSVKFGVSLLEFAWKGISVAVIKHISLWNTKISSGMTQCCGCILLQMGASAPSCQHWGHRYRKAEYGLVHLVRSNSCEQVGMASS